MCTGNSCRSQIAEGLAKKYLSKCFIESAGTHPEIINPIAIKVMKEINIDISNNYSKSISEEKIKTFDLGITLCGDAKDNCINLTNLVKQNLHWDIIDPAKINGTDDEKLNVFRNVRDKLEYKIKILRKHLS